MGKLLRKEYCPIGPDCPAIEQAEGGGYDVTGPLVDDPDREVTIHVPANLLPELGSLDIPDFMAYLYATRKTPGDVLRVQTLDQYGVPADDEDFQRYLAGAPVPASPYRQPWFDKLRADTAAGRRWRNVHIVRQPLSDYLRYAFEWGYTATVDAGQDVRICEPHKMLEPLFTTGDFWVIDGKHVVLARYDEQGRPKGTVGVDASATSAYIALANIAWNNSTSFMGWWGYHPQYHRDQRAA